MQGPQGFYWSHFLTSKLSSRALLVLKGGSKLKNCISCKKGVNDLVRIEGKKQGTEAGQVPLSKHQ